MIIPLLKKLVKLGGYFQLDKHKLEVARNSNVFKVDSFVALLETNSKF
jgi:hypothetical protein